MEPNEKKSRLLQVGLDVGSTTVKIVVVDDSGKTLFRSYRRHHALLAKTASELLAKAAEIFGETPAKIAVCGSGGRPISQALNAIYVQEVIANAVAIGALYPQARCAVELGGQDAKIVFFRTDERSGELVASDMRMNGSCAGGTGAFIDEIAKLLDVPDEGLESLAARGAKVYGISGRCGVFAKTDIQPLRAQGARSEDLALSAFHAIAKQTIGGLAQGLELEHPIVFEGGPLTYNPTLVRVFEERLGLEEGQAIIPEHPETIVAYGAALAVDKTMPTQGEEGGAWSLASAAAKVAEWSNSREDLNPASSPPLFPDVSERDRFTLRHELERGVLADPGEEAAIDCYVGVDSGSTTSKIALLDAKGRVFDIFYARNNGDPLEAVRHSLLSLQEKYRCRGQELNVIGLGVTGYGEKMTAAALGADLSTVETVAHARGCTEYAPDASFVLDIGGQDMKAIWLKGGVVTKIMLNEACSSGCGSFLEAFADSLGICVGDIAKSAFSSASPAKLGSRCTVFMTSTIITAQRSGKEPADIMAGLCRSIVENVFTKVIRVGSTDELGPRIVVQGGTFENDAVLRALEEYLGREVVRAPFPGEMGAVGAALLCRDASPIENGHLAPSGFIGFSALRKLSCTQESGQVCAGCANSCNRTITRFSTGSAHVTGGKCPRGEITSAGTFHAPPKTATNLHEIRAKMLFERYKIEPVRPSAHQSIGLPRILEFWDSMPFWTTFLSALGYDVVFSRPSSARLFESGLRYVASDTVCMPAKVVHGHVLDLCKRGVDRILLPHVMHEPPEGTDKTSPYMCAILMGYPMVVRNFQDPAGSFDVKFDTPVFHWFSEKNRKEQICAWACESLEVTRKEARAAFEQGESALKIFRAKLVMHGSKILDDVHERDATAVVIAGRPYHSDPYLSHEVARRFSTRGIPVLTPDSLPSLSKMPLEHLLPEITNNFHTRMYESALIAAGDTNLEYVQIVSFGCGHDAILTDELTRILDEIGGKHPLVLKLDESSAESSVDIRVQSFIETMRHGNGNANDSDPHDAEKAPRFADTLRDPYQVAYGKEDKARRTVLIPNISHEVSTLLSCAMMAEGYQAKVLPTGGPEQMQTGKRYTHNDICFPCQMVIGEAIDELRRGDWSHDEVAVGMVKFKCDCRMSHYAALLRRALDRAGFADVPILTTDPVDTKGMHSGITMLSAGSVIKAVWATMMLDVLEGLKRKTRPYELNPGQTISVFESCVNDIAQSLQHGLSPAISAYKRAISRMAEIPYDRSEPKPRVFVTGELLVTHHPGSNFQIEDYLVEHGMEATLPRVTDQLRKDFIAAMSEIKDFGADMTKESFPATALFELAQKTMDRIARKHPLYESDAPPKKMYESVSDLIPKTLSCGEGWLMAAEIEHWAKRGVRSFVILQPFGCLPNHICGRGVTKPLKERHPGIRILPLDLDPDTSFANVENRLQMLIMADRAQRRDAEKHVTEKTEPDKRATTAESCGSGPPTKT